MRRINYRPANLFKRFLAFMFDYLPIQLGLYAVSLSVFGISPMGDPFSSFKDYGDSLKAKLLADLGGIVIYVVYCMAGEMSPWRGTYGKKMMGISVKSIRGSKLTFKQILRRNCAKILSMTPCYLGCFVAFFTHGNRAWHDSLSGTAVAESK